MGILTGRKTAAVLEQAFQVLGVLIAIGWIALVLWLASVGAAEIAGVLVLISLFVILIFIRNDLTD